MMNLVILSLFLLSSLNTPSTTAAPSHDSSSSDSSSASGLSFVSKNPYSSFDSSAPRTPTGPSIEPYRPTYFTACSSPLEVSENLRLSRPAEDALYKELKDLSERGSNNAEMLRGKIDGAKRRFNEAGEAEGEVEGVSYEWVIDGKAYRGRTVGPLMWEHDKGQVSVKLSREGEGGGAVEIEVPVRHVRRGLGELRAEDRKKFFER